LVRVLLPCSASYIAFTPHTLTESPLKHDSGNQFHDAVGKDEQYLVLVLSPHLPHHARQDSLLKFRFLFLLGEHKFDPVDSGRIWVSKQLSLVFEIPLSLQKVDAKKATQPIPKK